MELIDAVAAKFHEEPGVFKLLVRTQTLTLLFTCVILGQIVDSIMALFRVDFSGRGELADRQQKLAQMLSRLQKVSEGILRYCVQSLVSIHCVARIQCCSVCNKPNDSRSWRYALAKLHFLLFTLFLICAKL